MRVRMSTYAGPGVKSSGAAVAAQTPTKEVKQAVLWGNADPLGVVSKKDQSALTGMILNTQLEQAKTEERQAQNRVDEYLFDNFAWLDTKDPAELEELNTQASAATQKRETIQTQVDALEYAQKYSEKTYPDNFFGQTAASYTLGRMNQDSALAWDDYWKEPTQANRDKAQAIDETLYQFQRNNTQTLDDDATLPWISRSTASQIPQVLDSVKYGAVGALGGAVVGSAVPVVGTAAGAKAGYTAGSTKYAHDTMRGAAFRDLLAQGVDEETARSAAGSEALVNGAVEAADTLLDLTALGAGTAAKKGVGYAAGIGMGGAQEGVQTLVSTANLRRAQEGKTGVLGLVGDTAKLTWDALTGKDKETAQQAWSAAKEGMKVSTVLNGAANAASLPFTYASKPAIVSGPTLSASEITVMQQELAQMQNRKQLDELAAVYEENVPLLSDVSANAIISDKNSTLKGGSDSGETRKETRTDFDRRCYEEGITVYEGRQVAYGVRLVRGESAQQNARQVQKEVEELGINAVIVDGEIQYNQDNVTGMRAVPEAATIGRRQIVIGNSVSLPAKNVAGHEVFHLWGNTEAREQYVDIIATNLLYDSEEFNYYQKAIVKEYFKKNKNVDITDPVQAAKLMEEINAYISGDIHEGVNDDMLRPMFRDYDAVKAAWNKLVEQNGKRTIP